MDIQAYTPAELLGPLNDVEQRNAPAKLYITGDKSILQTGGRVSVVGSRKASHKGLARARKLTAMLVDRGIVVVSGLAEGIDTAAHKTAIQNGGRTVAVVGTGLDKVFPASNRALFQEITTKHLAISQFSLGTAGYPSNFPMRNRTMALLSDATVIIEAGEKSGTLHQGWEALRLGRSLFISKSTAESTELTWPSEMVKYGAHILSDETIDDLFELLPDRIAADVDGAVL